MVGEARESVGDLPAWTTFVARPVEPEQLVIGQGLLDEPGEDPQGWRLAPWLQAALFGPPRPATGGNLIPDVCARQVGTPEAVTPIYVRPPDADIHITKMRDPWAGPAGAGDGRKSNRNG